MSRPKRNSTTRKAKGARVGIAYPMATLPEHVRRYSWRFGGASFSWNWRRKPVPAERGRA